MVDSNNPYRLSLRDFCLALPGAWEDFPWDQATYKVGKKAFVFTSGIEPLGVTVKTTADRQSVLIQDPAIIPAPYLHHHHWVMVTVTDEETLQLALSLAEDSHRLVVKGLPKSKQKEIGLL